MMGSGKFRRPAARDRSGRSGSELFYVEPGGALMAGAHRPRERVERERPVEDRRGAVYDRRLREWPDL